MDDITPRIEPASSYREPDKDLPPLRTQKPRPRAKAASAQGDSSEPFEPEDSDKHELDTMA